MVKTYFSKAYFVLKAGWSFHGTLYFWAFFTRHLLFINSKYNFTECYNFANMRIIVITFFLTTLALFFSVKVSPETLSYTGLLPLLIPIFILLNLALLLIFIFTGNKLLVFPLIALAIGWKFFVITFQLNESNSNPTGLSVLSYNVHFFNFRSKDRGQTSHAIQWVKDHPSDIKCLQEFLDDYTTPSFNSMEQLTQDGDYEVSYYIIDGNLKRRSHGLAIFSKYPIINEGQIFDNQRSNGAMFVDIKVDQDTIRIYNAHLESMNIKTDRLGDTEGIKRTYRETLRKLKNGIRMRARQVKVLSEHIKNSPYPVILVGDFNDVPYSYTYFALKSILKNAFEEAGRGFGFTYNKVLFFLRIDHIFYHDSLDITSFKTHREVDYSDHYPVSATFEIKKSADEGSE